ncbi:MAG: 3-dehydroquinate synthase [Bacteroidota bacterium]|nr:3-dehydroquinate synthase [Bacteroidota bacterium]
MTNHKLRSTKNRVQIRVKVIIGVTLQATARDIVQQFPRSRCFIVTDSNVKRLYSIDFELFLKKAGMETHLISFRAGESSKTRRTKEYIEDRLLKYRADRNSIIIAIGGGVVGDIAGFTAATYHRGIEYIQVPTTLLAQVDSSVGGKTAVNHPLGKNLIGSFYHPVRVYINTDTLSTLPQRQFKNGIAEIIKYGAILDLELFQYLDINRQKILNRDKSCLVHIIKRCCELKALVVQKDPEEKSYRRILNFGHTIGHAVEKLSNYKVPHGYAVAIGMVGEALIAKNLGLLSLEGFQKLQKLILSYKLPVSIPCRFTLDEILTATRSDKKGKNDKIMYTLISKIGIAKIDVPLSVNKVRKLLIKDKNFFEK